MGNNADDKTARSFSAQSENGVATIVFADCYSATPSAIAVDIESSAFGWIGEPKHLVLQDKDENVLDFPLSPTVAIDDFTGTGLKPFWANSGAINWQVVQQSGNGILRLDTRSANSGYGILNCGNTLSPNGSKYVSISFDMRNYVTTSTRADYFKIGRAHV